MTRVGDDKQKHMRLAIAAAVLGGLALLFLSSIWGLASNYAYNRAEAEYHTGKDREDADRRISERCVRLEPPDSATCIRQAIESSHEDQRAEQNLEAQRNTAVWTGIMAALAGLGVILSFGGVYLVYATFQQARRSADSATDAVEAGRVANQLAREEFEAARREARAAAEEAAASKAITKSAAITQTRPWISIEDVTVGLRCMLDNILDVHVQFRLINHGVSPAVAVVPQIACDWYSSVPGRLGWQGRLTAAMAHHELHAPVGFGMTIPPGKHILDSRGAGLIMVEGLEIIIPAFCVSVTYRMPNEDATFATGQIFYASKRGLASAGAVRGGHVMIGFFPDDLKKDLEWVPAEVSRWNQGDRNF
jgi:hypothetical protein